MRSLSSVSKTSSRLSPANFSNLTLYWRGAEVTYSDEVEEIFPVV